jgi:chromosome segregation ATPase
LSAKAAAEISKAKEQYAVSEAASAAPGGAGMEPSSSAGATADLLQLGDADNEIAAASTAFLPDAAAATDGPSPATHSSTTSGDGVSREELLEVLQKMNKKVKVLSLQKQQLVEQHREALLAKDRIRALVVDEILNGGPPGLRSPPSGNSGQIGDGSSNEDDVRQLQAAWRAQDEQNSLALQQIQSEFQKLRLAQTAQNGDGPASSHSRSWETERAELVEQHRKEMEALRQSLSSQQQQTTTPPPPTTPTTPAGVDAAPPLSPATPLSPSANEEVQKVKDAAAAQIDALKKKFVVAHNNGVAKIKAEMQDAHRKAIEEMRAELEASHRHEVERTRLQHEQLLEAAVQRQQAAAAAEPSSEVEAAAAEAEAAAALQLDHLKAAHAEELRQHDEAAASRLAAEVERARLEVEQAVTTEMEEKLQELLGDLRRKHQDEVAQLQERSAAELSRKLTETQAASAETIRQLESQLEEMSKASEEASRSLREKAEATSSVEKQLTDTMAAAEAELARLRESAVVAHGESQVMIRTLEVRLESAEREHSAALESLRAELEGAGAARYSDVAASKQEEMQELRGSLEAEWSQLTERLSAEHAAELESLRKTFEQQTSSMQETLSIERQKHAEALAAVSDGSSAKLSSLLGETEAKFAEERRQLQEAAVRAKDEAALAVRAELTAELDRARSEQQRAVQDLAKHAREADATLGESQSRSKALSEELEAARRRLDEVEGEKATLTASLQDHDSSIQAQLQEELVQRQQDHDRIVSELKDEVQRANIGRQGTLLEVESLKSKVSQLDVQVTSLSKQLEEAQTRAEASEVAAQQARADAQSRIEAALAESTTQNDDMRKSMESHVDKMKAHFLSKIAAAKEASSSEIKSLQETVKDKDEKLAKLVERLKSITAGTANLKNENEELKLKLASDASIQSALRSELQTLQRSMDETVSNSSATATSLLRQQETLEGEKLALERQVSELKTSREELSGKLRGLTANLNTMVEERKESQQKLAAAAKLEAKLAASEAEVSGLREQINKLKLDLTQNSSLVARLQSEKDATERASGERTALVGMLESRLAESADKVSELHAKLEASLYDLSQKDEALRSSDDRVRQLDSEIAEARSATKRATEALAVAQKGADMKTTKTVESLQKELQSVRQQMARKSSAAQKLLQEREAECSELRKANASLQQEVDKGSLSDRRIFELAAKQSNRESQQASEIDIRDKTIETIKTALLERDGELAHAEKKVIDVESQVEELCRVRRREDVNLDYLKDIVVKYLSLPPGSSERARLLPVLATLLQFNALDYQTIEEGKKKVSWWGSVSPTLINAPEAGATQSGSAEVSVTREAQAQRMTTSLQF